MLTVVVFDIDGVLTGGEIYIDQDGKELKAYNITEIDALNDIQRMGYKIAAVTGECTPIVDVFRRRVPWDQFIAGCKDKKAALKALELEFGVTKEAICYIGDGKYDVPAIQYAGVGVCPQNAIPEVKLAADIVLRESGGKHCVAELHSLLKKIKLDTTEDSVHFTGCFEDGLSEHLRMFETIRKSDPLRTTIEQAAKIILCALQSGRALYLCGNGGSAADSQHIAAEFVSRFYRERPAFNAESLTVNTSSLTAIGNDYDFERVFVRQLEARGRAGDVLIGISTSGTSKNVTKAAEYARRNEIHTILLTGDRRLELGEGIYECIIKIPSKDTPRIQEGHIFVGHMLAEYVESLLASS